MPVTEHTVFNTDDGLMWNNKQEAESHQAFLDLRQFYDDALGKQDPMSAIIADFVWRHRERVTDILSRALPPTDTEKLGG